jgi:hypothetical protein
MTLARASTIGLKIPNILILEVHFNASKNAAVDRSLARFIALWSKSLGANQVLKCQYWVGFLTHDRHGSHYDRYIWCAISLSDGSLSALG